MNLLKKISYIFAIGFLLLGFANHSLAFIEPVAILTAGEKKLELSEEVFSNLKGEGKLESQNFILEKQVSVIDVLKNFYGQPLASGSIVKYYKNSPEKIFKLLNDFSYSVNTPSQESVFKTENGFVTEFSPSAVGKKLDPYENTLLVLEALEKNQTNIVLKVRDVFPKKSLANSNSLGIQELLAKGESNFKGSPKNRRHNIEVGVSKFKGLIVAKGEEFSFNKYLGPVEAEQGFLPELVIKKEGTIPEFGGGLCQVSSTAFRAAMQAGLPITQRRNHAYAVQYYSPQGTDATIYPGVVDLKFINDTPGAILIWPYFKDKDNLVFEFYGTKDERKVNLETPVTYEKLPDGSMKSYWNRTVIKNGVEKKDNFKSTYASPALYHKQEEFVKTDGTSSGGLKMPKLN